MNSLYAEQFFLSQEAYTEIIKAYNQKNILKNKKRIITLSMAQIIIGTFYIFYVMFAAKVKEPMMIIFAVFLIVWGVYGFFRVKNFDKILEKSILSKYSQAGYGKKPFETEFFADYVKYDMGTSAGELSYGDLDDFMEGEKFYALRFKTGEAIIFNKDCNWQKIKDIVNAFEPKAEEETEAEIVKADVLPEQTEEI